MDMSKETAGRFRSTQEILSFFPMATHTSWETVHPLLQWTMDVNSNGSCPRDSSCPGLAAAYAPRMNGSAPQREQAETVTWLATALPRAPVFLDVEAPAVGYVAELHSMEIGRVALHLGAGRSTKEDPVDHAVGVICVRKRGDRVEQGEPLAQIHARTDQAARTAAEHVLDAYELAGEPPAERPIILETLG